MTPTGLPTSSPTSAPSAAPYFENYDGLDGKVDEKNAQCTVTDDIGAVYTVDDSINNAVATFQFDVEIGENSIQIGSVDLCVASKVLDGESMDEVCIIESMSHEPVLGSFPLL